MNKNIKFNNLKPDTYFIKPMLRDYTFEPEMKTIELKVWNENLKNEYLIKFKAIKNMYSVIGFVKLLNNVEPASHIIIQLIDVNTNEIHDETISDMNGKYKFDSILPNKDYEMKILKNSTLFYNHTELLNPSTYKKQISNLLSGTIKYYTPPTIKFNQNVTNDLIVHNFNIETIEIIQFTGKLFRVLPNSLMETNENTIGDQYKNYLLNNHVEVNLRFGSTPEHSRIIEWCKRICRY
jgi:hypothetical protein